MSRKFTETVEAWVAGNATYDDVLSATPTEATSAVDLHAAFVLLGRYIAELRRENVALTADFNAAESELKEEEDNYQKLSDHICEVGKAFQPFAPPGVEIFYDAHTTLDCIKAHFDAAERERS